MPTFYKFLRSLWPFIAPVLGVISFAALVDFNIGDIAVAYSVVVPRLLTLNVLYVVLIALFAFFTYVEFRHKNTPLTVVSNDISLTLETPSGNRAKLVRTQRIRANRDDVTGYHRIIRTDGRIQKSQIICNINHCTDEEQSCHFDGDEKRWEFIHRFREIPRKLYMLGLNTVTRTEQITLHDAFIKDEEFLDLEIPAQYPHRNMTLRIYFHPDRPVSFDKCKAICITQNGILDINLNPIPPAGGSAEGVQLNIKGKPCDRFRITWTYPLLLQPQTAPPKGSN